MKILNFFKRKKKINPLNKGKKDTIPKKECLDINILWDYLYNRLSDKDKEATEAHFADCDMCRMEMITAKLLLNDENLIAESFNRVFNSERPKQSSSFQKICKRLSITPVIDWLSESLIPDLPVQFATAGVRCGHSKSEDYLTREIKIRCGSDKSEDCLTEEKRKDSRVKWHNLSYICTGEKGVISNEGMGRTLDVSEGGILLETYFFIDADQSLFLTIAVGEEIVNIRGIVKHSRPGKDRMFETGVEFVETKETDLEVLRKYIKIFKEKVKSGDWTVDSEYLLLGREEPVCIYRKKDFEDICIHILIEESRTERFNLKVFAENGNKKSESLKIYLISGKNEDFKSLVKGKVEIFKSLPFGKYEVILKQNNKEKGRTVFDISDRGLHEEE